MSDYLIILHDAEPPTDQGREQLQQELIAKLGITEDAVREMFTSLPVILKENVSRQHAEDFLRVLESMGANVEIIASGNEDGSALSTHSEGETPLLQIKEDDSTLDDDNDFDLSLEQTSSATESGNAEESKESVEDLEAILSTMLNGDDDLPTTASEPLEREKEANSTEDPDSAGEFFVEQETPSDVDESVAEPVEESSEADDNGLSFVLDAEEGGVEAEEDSLDSDNDDGPSIDDLNRILEEELGGVTQSAQAEENTSEVSSAALAFSLDTDEAEGEEQEDLENLVGEALASFGDAESEVKSDSPTKEQPTADTSEVLFSLEGESNDEESSDTAAATTSAETNESANDAAPQKEDKPAADSSGAELNFSLDEPEEEEEPSESALEAALSNLGAEAIGDDDDEEDPFAGLDLPGAEPEESTESSAAPAGKTISEKKAEERQRRKAAKEQAAQEEIATAFNSAANASERETLETSTIEASKDDLSASSNSAAADRQEKLKRFGIALVFAVLFTIAIKPDLVFPPKDQATLLSSAQLDAMLEKEAQRKEALSRAQQIAAKPTIQRWASDTKLESGQRVNIEILTNGNKIMGFEFLYEGPQPAEITPEELIEGVDRPWVRKITANALSLAEVVERTTSKTGTKKILVAESPARAYVSDLQGSTRFAGTVRVELEISSSSELKGSWQVHTDSTPAELREEEFYVKRLEEGGFQLSLNGNVVMTPLTLASSDEKSKKAD